MSKLKLLLLIALPSLAFSQTIPPPAPAASTVCMPVATAAKVRDSLAALPLVRKEAANWRYAAGRYKLAADNSFESYLNQVQANGSTKLALREQKVETARQESYAKEWRDKAKRRGFWNWVAVAAAVAAVSLRFAAR